jgi:hypothetical protein
LLCIGGPGLAPVLDEGPTAGPREHLTLEDMCELGSQKVAFSDAVTLATLTGFLASRGATYRIAHESEAGLDDLRQALRVLIGSQQRLGPSPRAGTAVHLRL